MERLYNNINNGMCRCCASEGTFKDLSSKYRWMGVEEVYADMLRECFDVTLTYPEENPEAGICEVCITQLRNAANFKKQVLNTEEQFKKMLQNKTNIVKVEVSPPEDDGVQFTDEDNNLSNDDFSSTEYEVPIKTESEEGKSRKRSAKAGPSRSKQPKMEGESSAKRIASKTDKSIVGTPANKVLQLIRAKIKVEPQDEWAVSIKRKVKKQCQEKSQTLSTAPLAMKEIDKHIHNVREILLNTNATPIRTHVGIGYTCFFCYNRPYPELHDLKAHTLLTHSSKDTMNYMENYSLGAFVPKLDVTSFQCIICLESIVTLEDMMKHLTSEHNKLFYTDVKNRILPFRFEEGVFTCVLCQKVIEHFKVMQEHLNVHYGSYYCDICSAPFVTSRNLMSHVKRHKQGEFVCKVCSKVFDTATKRDDHEKIVHGGVNRSKCPVCLEKFSSHLKRLDHMAEEHGMEKTVYKCMACDKSFSCSSKLNKHRRRDHLLERSHKCDQCDKKFFSSKQLKSHMVSHTGERAFQCDVCLKSYGRKHTLREHMRIHADDRRFKCDHCDQAFVQKCSWKSHLRSKHGIVAS